MNLVGAGLLAMGSSAPRLSSSYALSLATIASKLAPTRGRVPTLKPVEAPKKRPRKCEAFHFGFNRFNFAASIPEKVRT